MPSFPDRSSLRRLIGWPLAMRHDGAEIGFKMPELLLWVVSRPLSRKTTFSPALASVVQRRGEARGLSWLGAIGFVLEQVAGLVRLIPPPPPRARSALPRERFSPLTVSGNGARGTARVRAVQ
jgi:hypothetical protein